MKIREQCAIKTAVKVFLEVDKQHRLNSSPICEVVSNPDPYFKNTNPRPEFEGGKDVFIPPTNYMFMENVKTFKPLTPG